MVATGQHLISPDGLFTFTFAGQPAPVHCPTETRCIGTVPDLPGRHARVIPVVLSTPGATSRPFRFLYRP